MMTFVLVLMKFPSECVCVPRVPAPCACASPLYHFLCMLAFCHMVRFVKYFPFKFEASVIFPHCSYVNIITLLYQPGEKLVALIIFGKKRLASYFCGQNLSRISVDRLQDIKYYMIETLGLQFSYNLITNLRQKHQHPHTSMPANRSKYFNTFPNQLFFNSKIIC